MATKSTHIHVDAEIKEQVTELFNSLGLGVSDAVNVFFRAALDARGFPFPVEKPLPDAELRAQNFVEFVELARNNTVFERGFKFDRNEINARKDIY